MNLSSAHGITSDRDTGRRWSELASPNGLSLNTDSHERQMHKHSTRGPTILLSASEVKARFPLREAKVSVREHPEKPGSYLCVVHLRPHFQLDELVASVKLVTETAPLS